MSGIIIRAYAYLDPYKGYGDAGTAFYLITTEEELKASLRSKDKPKRGWHDDSIRLITRVNLIEDSSLWKRLKEAGYSYMSHGLDIIEGIPAPPPVHRFNRVWELVDI